MKLPILTTALVCLSLAPAFAAEHALSTVKGAPDGLAPEVAARLRPEGTRVSGENDGYCTIWLAQELPVKPGFKPTLNIKYPFTSGQLIGALRVDEKAGFTDFRGQEIAAGTYTLRYGQQPVDGNHIGTSELYDFLLALPADVDKTPATIASFEELSMESAQAAGSNHPAILSMLPAEDGAGRAQLVHDENRDYWILALKAAGKADDKSVSVPLRIVVIGRSEI